MRNIQHKGSYAEYEGKHVERVPQSEEVVGFHFVNQTKDTAKDF